MTSKSELYTLIIAQLLHDGYIDTAHAVGAAAQIAVTSSDATPSMPARVAENRLAALVEAGLEHEKVTTGHDQVSIYSRDALSDSQAAHSFRSPLPPVDFDSDNANDETNTSVEYILD